MLQELFSKCCNSKIKVVGGDEGTNHYECLKCKKPCDFRIPEEPKVKCSHGCPWTHQPEHWHYKKLIKKYGDAHGYKQVGYKGISAWINEGKKYQFFDFIDSKMLIEFRDRTHKIGKHGAVAFVGQKEDICAECRKPVIRKFRNTGINPPKQRVYRRLEKMQLKDLADKCNELAEELSTKK